MSGGGMSLWESVKAAASSAAESTEKAMKTMKYKAQVRIKHNAIERVKRQFGEDLFDDMLAKKGTTRDLFQSTQEIIQDLREQIAEREDKLVELDPAYRRTVPKSHSPLQKNPEGKRGSTSAGAVAAAGAPPHRVGPTPGPINAGGAGANPRAPLQSTQSAANLLGNAGPRPAAPSGRPPPESNRTPVVSKAASFAPSSSSSSSSSSATLKPAAAVAGGGGGFRGHNNNSSGSSSSNVNSGGEVRPSGGVGGAGGGNSTSRAGPACAKCRKPILKDYVSLKGNEEEMFHPECAAMACSQCGATLPTSKPTTLLDGRLFCDSCAGKRQQLAAPSHGASSASPTNSMLQWVRNSTQGFNGVRVDNFTKSWVDGLAFASLVAVYAPACLDFSCLKPGGGQSTLQAAFAGLSRAKVVVLLDVEDVQYADNKSIMTQVSTIQRKFAAVRPDPQGKVKWNKAIPS